VGDQPNRSPEHAAQEAEELFYRKAVRRIYVNLLWVSAAGALAALAYKDWLWAVGFLIGAVASVLNFRWLHQLANALGPGGRSPRKHLGLVLGLRYLLFAAGAYVIVRYSNIDLMAALLGLFVAVAAVLVEMLYELVYART
jgi:hypothetical protein